MLDEAQAEYKIEWGSPTVSGVIYAGMAGVFGAQLLERQELGYPTINCYIKHVLFQPKAEWLLITPEQATRILEREQGKR